MSVWSTFARHAEALRLELRSRPVLPGLGPRELERELAARYDFSRPLSADGLVDDVARLLEDGLVQVTHPRYFGLFNPSVREAAVYGDVLAALFNPQLAVRAHAPAADALERLVLRCLARHVGPHFEQGAMHFTSGGAEANLSALLSALARAVPQALEVGLAGAGLRPRVYVTREGHHSFVKAVRMAGLGTAALREVPLGAGDVMDPAALASALREDAAAGLLPLLVVATAGTTAAGLVDPLVEVARVAASAGVWLHVDAAWGGLALLSPRLRPALAGIEQADSVTWDAHKGLAVPMGAGMFFCRHPDAVQRAFAVTASYMPVASSEAEPFASTAQWSRRAIGLKVFMALAELGLPGAAAMVEEQARLADTLRERLRAEGWVLLNATPLPVVCFTHASIRAGATTTAQVLARALADGQVWLSEVHLAGRERALRACITSFRTDALDVDALVQALHSALGTGPGLRRPPARPPRVALVTYGGFPELTPDDRLLQQELAREGVRADAVAWDSPTARWGDFEALLLRSTWDYHLRWQAFDAWLGERERAGDRLLNPVPLVRWNLDKAYLAELARRGVRVPPTRHLRGDAPVLLEEVLRQEEWERAVVKPAISASAHETWRVERAGAAQHQLRFERQLRAGPLLVQAFVPEVEDGEWSLCFVGGRLSHAVLKRPAAGDFRVQVQFGGRVAAATPPPEAVQAALTALACVPGVPLYARVDGCMADGAFVLMELELIEPALFLSTAEGAAARLAKAVRTTLGGAVAGASERG